MPGLLRGVARTAVIAGTATAVSNRVSRRQGQRWAAAGSSQQAAEAAGPPPAAGATGRRLDDRPAQGARRAESPGDPHRGGVRRPEGQDLGGLTLPASLSPGGASAGMCCSRWRGDRLAHPLLGGRGRPSGNGPGASSGHSSGSPAISQLTASRSKSSSERRCQASSWEVAAVAGALPRSCAMVPRAQ